VAISRARHTAIYPAAFMLVAATNPCPCGYAGQADRCDCSEAPMARHRRRLSGPLLDRIDLLAGLERDVRGELGEERTTSRQARELVIQARERQAARLGGDGVRANAQMDPQMLSRHVRLEADGEEMLRRAGEAGLLSARGRHRVLRVARTIADLNASEAVRKQHLGAALALRPRMSLAGDRAA